MIRICLVGSTFSLLLRFLFLWVTSQRACKKIIQHSKNWDLGYWKVCESLAESYYVQMACSS